MADFLWTSRTVGATATVEDHIRKYCFNAPGNWKIWNPTTLSWDLTTVTPGSSAAMNDTCYIGVEYYPPLGKNRTGWTAAKHPLLFGGVSGDINAGWTGISDWRFGSASAAKYGYVKAFYHCVGITRPSGGIDSVPVDLDTNIAAIPPYNQLGTTVNPLNDYPFPYLGNGISGEVAEWCAARDGLTVGSYVAANYSGWHNPTDELKLKLVSMLSIEDMRIAGIPGQTTTNPFMASITVYPQYMSPNTTSWGDPKGKIETDLVVLNLNGSGVSINGGKFRRVVINKFAFGTSGLIGPLFSSIGPYSRASVLRPFPTSEVIDYKIKLNNVSAWFVAASNLQGLGLYGGNYSKIDLDLHGSAISHRYPNGMSPATFMERVAENFQGVTKTVPTSSGFTTILANGWNWTIPWAFAVGQAGDALENSDPRETGVLNITSRVNDAGPSSGRANLVMREPGVFNISTGFFQYPGNTAQQWEFGSIYDRQRATSKVVLGDPDNTGFTFGYDGATASWGEIMLRQVNIIGGIRSGDAIYSTFIPPCLEFASGGYIQTLQTEAAIVQVNPNLNQATPIKIGTLQMKTASRVYLDNKNVQFGFLTYDGPGNRGRFVGGATSLDWTQNMIFADANHAFWGSGVVANRILRNNPNAVETSDSPKPPTT